MSMKRFLSRSKDDKGKEKDSGRAGSVVEPENLDMAPVGSDNTEGSRDSLTEMYPMFEGSSSVARDNPQGQFQKFNFNNDPKLANPSISSKTASVFTKESDYMGKSIFSRSRKTFSTKQSSYGASGDQGGKKESGSSFTYSQPLQILNIAEESAQDTKNKSPSEILTDKLQQLYDDLAFIIHQFDNSIINLTTAVINSIDQFKKFIAHAEELKANKPEAKWRFTTYNNTSLRKILKMYLHFYDNLLKDEVYIKLKLLLVKNFNDLAISLNTELTEQSVPQTIVKPQNFAIGVNQGMSLPNEDVLTRIIEKISKTFISLKEQNGSFIAPIARGISNDLHILCLYFGYPNPTDYHVKLTQSLHGLYDDIHIIVMKNQIDLASTTGDPVSKFSHLNAQQYASKPKAGSQASFVQPANPQKFKLPFRIPTDSQRLPISLSLSIENSIRTSGTMGGYIYPIIDLEKQPHLKSYTNSKFAISCGHVCLDTTTGSTTTEYPHVSAPSSVLIYLYKQALMAQYKKVMINNGGNDSIVVAESQAAYGSVIKQVEEMFPLKRVKVKDPKTKQEGYELRNLPQSRFGQIIWGERTLIESTKREDESRDVEKKLSDLAIIKVNKNLICDQNYLGDDIPFNEFDPALMFDNLYVRKVIDLQRHLRKTMDLNVDEVDSTFSDDTVPENYNGLPVFKYGSTTKFTKGNLNGIKLVYWLDGAIHSSEFIVNSVENNTAFAAGGDSGSWILTKLEDIEPHAKGLGVVGMLHSYDGEFKQFGLYTPMCEILTRLKEVTGIKWGVVGVKPEKGEDYDSEAELSSESESTYSDEAESDVEEGAYPPEVD